MKVNKSNRGLVIATAAALTLLVGCGQSPDAVETKSESTQKTAAGKVETKEESKQVGSTLEAKSETTVKADDGTTAKSNVETFIGTVTVYEAGKKIEVLTGENARHTVSLDDKNTVAVVASAVAVGKRVRLVDEKQSTGSHRVTVTLEG